MSDSITAASSPSRLRAVLTVSVVGLTIVLGAGLLWAFSGGADAPVGAGWYLFSYVMGLTMIVLPCTLPLAFVIVPMAMGKSPRKGITMALAFSIGIAITLSFYGVLAAWLGAAFLERSANDIETVKNVMYLLAGAFAYVFALGELGFLKVRMPTYSGAAPMFIQRRRDVSKALFLGLFMGNIGIGCPHPATPVILSRIAVSGDVFYGWLLFFVHALGRITPLLLLALLAILGVNALSWVVKRRTGIERATGWAMVFVAAFILVLGLFTHDWWVNSGQHTTLESVTQEERFLGIVSERIGAEAPHTHGPEEGPGMFGLPLWLGNWALVFLWVVPLLWYVRRRQNRLAGLPQAEQDRERAVMPWLKAFVVVFVLLLGFVFIWALPHRFLEREAIEDAHHEEETLREGDVHDIAVAFVSDPETIAVGVPTTLSFTFPGARLDDFEIEHERLLHLVAVREDLTIFAHVHPEPATESPARFDLTHTFSLSGTYLLSLNYVHDGVEGTWQKTVEVAGNDAVVRDSDTARTKQSGLYEVTLYADPEMPRAGEETHLRWTILKDGEPVVDLSPYLGAPAHIAVVRDDLEFFVHEHGDLPEGAAALPFFSSVFAHGEEMPAEDVGHGEHADLPSAFGPSVEALLTLPQAGRYKIFAEFLHEQRVLTAGFLVDVSERR